MEYSKYLFKDNDPPIFANFWLVIFNRNKLFFYRIGYFKYYSRYW